MASGNRFFFPYPLPQNDMLDRELSLKILEFYIANGMIYGAFIFRIPSGYLSFVRKLIGIWVIPYEIIKKLKV